MTGASAKAGKVAGTNRREKAAPCKAVGLSPAQRAGYIEEMTAELEKLALGPDLERLRDLLGLARREARRLLIEQAG